MRVLVTGSAGRIGRRVVAALLARGDVVNGFDAQSTDVRHAGYREFVGAFEDAAACSGAMQGVDAALHLGALMSWLPQDASRVHAANVTGTLNVLTAATQAKVARFVFASSGEVYPETRARYSPVDEDHPLEPRSMYGLGKLLGEQMVAFFQRVHALPAVVLRFAHTQEAGELLDPSSFFSGPRFYLRAKIAQQQAFGNLRVARMLETLDSGVQAHLVQCSEDGTPYRMMIADARDIAEGVVLALDRPGAAGHTFNLGPDTPVRFDAAVAALAATTGLPVVRANLPGPPVDYVTSNAKARGMLGFAPRWTFDRMVADAAAQPRPSRNAARNLA